MEKIPQKRRRNPLATTPILRKGGAHLKSAAAERAKARSQLKQDIGEWRHGRN
ncbi:MAG: hypothetical protein IAF00_11510 [Phycisphaerales bacterium]|nr:hypothetical protein [Phycisphaerales bacterium]